MNEPPDDPGGGLTPLEVPEASNFITYPPNCPPREESDGSFFDTDASENTNTSTLKRKRVSVRKICKQCNKKKRKHRKVDGPVPSNECQCIFDDEMAVPTQSLGNNFTPPAPLHSSTPLLNESNVSQRVQPPPTEQPSAPVARPRCLSGVWWGAHPFSLKLLYNAIIRSILDYGTQFLEPCNVTGLRKLDAIQAKALRIVTGAMKSSPINALQVECADPPLRLRRQFLSDKFLFRALQLANHPLYSKLSNLSEYVNTSPYWAQKNPPCLVLSFRKFLSLQAPTHRSAYLPIFSSDYESLVLPLDITLDIELSKNDPHTNIKFNFLVDSRWQNWHHLYSDASKHLRNGHVGVGIFHKQYKIIQMVKFPPETSVFTGECYGIFKCLEYILLLKLKNLLFFLIPKAPFRH
ncbi:hypothetical protein HF086_013095 [Spodoptera exigua]|uniref:Uncharacterized protein n=1 Tax=Spodoptera exigua TaxID=7107 RepID=A0A922M9X7_SPOEX|nr:hypothetical protein HF086_013095 [Spodoptera exigua]